MIEMDEQFQQEFGAAMALLRAVHAELIGTAKNSRGEARAIAAAEEGDAAVVAYEASHAYWDSADRVRAVIGAFEEADRRAATLMEKVDPANPLASATPVWLAARVNQLESWVEISQRELEVQTRATRTFQERTHYLENQLARLDTALRGRPATLDEKIRETETTEDLIDAAVRLIEDRPERERAEREHERAQNLAKVTQEAARLLGVTTLPEILTALQRLVTGGPLNLDTLADGTLIAGQWIGSDLPARRWYLGRFERKLTDPDGAVIERICTACDGFKDTAHVVHTQLAAGSLRLPTADEIIEFSQLSKATGLLRLPDESDE